MCRSLQKLYWKTLDNPQYKALMILFTSSNLILLIGHKRSGRNDNHIAEEEWAHTTISKESISQKSQRSR